MASAKEPAAKDSKSTQAQPSAATTVIVTGSTTTIHREYPIGRSLIQDAYDQWYASKKPELSKEEQAAYERTSAAYDQWLTQERESLKKQQEMLMEMNHNHARQPPPEETIMRANSGGSDCTKTNNNNDSVMAEMAVWMYVDGMNGWEATDLKERVILIHQQKVSLSQPISDFHKVILKALEEAHRSVQPHPRYMSREIVQNIQKTSELTLVQLDAQDAMPMKKHTDLILRNASTLLSLKEENRWYWFSGLCWSEHPAVMEWQRTPKTPPRPMHLFIRSGRWCEQWGCARIQSLSPPALLSVWIQTAKATGVHPRKYIEETLQTGVAEQHLYSAWAASEGLTVEMLKKKLNLEERMDELNRRVDKGLQLVKESLLELCSYQIEMALLRTNQLTPVASSNK